MTNPAPITYPLGPPVVTNNVITVDMALQQPQYITQRLADLSLQRFVVNQIFASDSVAVQGGAVIYDQITANELYTTNDVERVAPGGEFPMVGGIRRSPLVALVDKWGGKFRFTDEARDRNDTALFNQRTIQLSNTIVRKVNANAMTLLDTTISGMSGATTFAAPKTWDTVVTGTNSPDSNSQFPAASFAHAQALADVQELGVTLDLLLLNPMNLASLKTIYGSQFEAVMAAHNLSWYASNRVTLGKAYFVAKGQVGFLKYEQGLGTETWRDPDHQSTLVQSSVKPVMGVTNPYAVYVVTGL